MSDKDKEEKILSPEELFEKIQSISKELPSLGFGDEKDWNDYNKAYTEKAISLIESRDTQIKIAENESILNLAETHGESERVKFTLKMRISDLKNYPKFLNAPDAI